MKFFEPEGPVGVPQFQPGFKVGKYPTEARNFWMVFSNGLVVSIYLPLDNPSEVAEVMIFKNSGHRVTSQFLVANDSEIAEIVRPEELAAVMKKIAEWKDG